MIKYNPRVSRHQKPFPSSIFLQAEHNHRVTITFDDETKSLIERLDAAIEYIAGLENVPANAMKTELDEPAELSVNIPDDLITPQKKYKESTEPDWNFTKNVKWKVQGNSLLIRYKNEEVVTDWETMKSLSLMDRNSRLGVIKDMLGDDFTPYKRTAYNQFAEHLAEGDIQAPVENPFLVAPDPYAPMLTGLGLTRTVGDFGKGEEEL